MKRLLTLLAMLAAATLSASTAQADESAQGDLGIFVVSMKLGDSGDKTADAKVLEGHIAYLNELYDQGVLYLAGPYADSYHEGQSVILADSAEEAQALVSNDPSVKAGLMTIESIRPWWAAFSMPDQRRFTVEQFTAMMGGAPGHGETVVQADESTAPVEGGSAASGSGADGMGMTMGAINWIEIPSSNPEESQAFYSKVFGWEVSSEQGMSFYTAPGGMSGMFTTESAPAAPRTGPVFYINCESVTAKLEEIKAAGGQAITEVMTLPNGWGFIAIWADPHGNQAGIWSAAE